MWLLSMVVLLIKGLGAATLWARLPLFQMELVNLYGLIVIALWYAPFYSWFLLVSGWARRAAFLWGLLPPLAIGVFEYIPFHTSYFAFLFKDRALAFSARAFYL